MLMKRGNDKKRYKTDADASEGWFTFSWGMGDVQGKSTQISDFKSTKPLAG